MTRRVAYSVGGDFWGPCYVSIYSLLANNPDSEFEIFVMSEEYDPTFFSNLEALEETHPSFSIEHVHVDPTEYHSLPTPSDFTVGTYYRLFMHEHLPVDGESVLYLDADTVIDDSLSDVFDRKLGGAAAAAAPDSVDRQIALGLDWDKQYVNAGVLYVDLETWADEELGKRCVEVITRHNFELPDQHALNIVLHEHDLLDLLDPKYNVSKGLAKQFHRGPFDPTIVHYTTENKPWFYGCENHYTDVWRRYCEETPYSETLPRRPSSRRQLGRLAHSLARVAGEALAPYPRLYTPLRRQYEDLFR